MLIRGSLIEDYWTNKVIAFFRLFSVFLLTATVGCTQQPASVSSLEIPPIKTIDKHVVMRGDTLYSIAWRYDLSAGALARVNGIGTDATIHPGQLLNLDMTVALPPSRIPVKAKKVAPIASRKSTVTELRSFAEQSPPVDPKVSPLKSSRAISAAVSDPSGSRTQKGWQWPVRGDVVERFNITKLHKGLKIKTVARAAVRSSAPGEIVYAGDGLRGYGKLVIIKHTDLLLSAYAHNDKILVREGQVIDTMQIIAKLGASGTLYFEIRKDGRPVDPVSYLNQ